MAPLCKNHYPVHFVAVDVKRTIVDHNFSLPKCVRLPRMSEITYGLLCLIFASVPERAKVDLEPTLETNGICLWDLRHF